MPVTRHSVTVKFYSALKKYSAGAAGEEQVEVAAGTTVGGLIARYGFQPGEVGLITVNKQLAGEDDPITESCLVEIFPPFAGG